MREPNPTIGPLAFAVPMLLAGLVFALAIVAAGYRDLPFPDWAQVVLCFGLPGAFGGILASVQHINLPGLLGSSENEHWTRDRARNVFLALLIGALGGVGGSGAALFVMLVDDKIKFPMTEVARLSAITSGLLGGFVGFQLLKRVAEGALNPAAKAEAEQAGKKAASKVAKQVSDERAALNEALLEAMAALGNRKSPKGKSAIREVTPTLEKLYAEYPDNRTAAIVLARLHRWGSGDYKKGIEVLTTCHKAMLDGKDDRARDIAAVLFNRACYWCQLSSAANNPNAADEKANCYKDLEAAIKSNAKVAADAADDDDFDPIKREERFKTLLAAHGVTV